MVEAGKHLREGSIKAYQLVESALKCQDYTKSLNAFVTPIQDAALAKADLSQKRYEKIVFCIITIFS